MKNWQIWISTTAWIIVFNLSCLAWQKCAVILSRVFIIIIIIIKIKDFHRPRIDLVYILYKKLFVLPRCIESFLENSNWRRENKVQRKFVSLLDSPTIEWFRLNSCVHPSQKSALARRFFLFYFAKNRMFRF